MITPALIREIRRGYRLPWHGLHGVRHWARVLENGLRLAASTGACREVVALFAVFHDARRLHEDYDPDHGRNWKNQTLSEWEKILHEFAIQPVQHFDLVKGKNVTDMAMHH